MNSLPTDRMTDTEWFNEGKADAWANNPKQAPVHDPQAASLYDLGYNEGGIGHSPTNAPVWLKRPNAPIL